MNADEARRDTDLSSVLERAQSKYGREREQLIRERDEARAELSKARDERNQLRDAIVAHRSQKADDRCIEDDDRLYEALGDGIKCDRRVGDKAAMLRNCERFIERRCESGGWPTYAELEAEIKKLRGMIVHCPNCGGDWLSTGLEARCPCLLKAELDRLKSAPIMREETEWTRTPPTEQGIYWHWNGNYGSDPLSIFVFYSGTSRKCFVSSGQLGIEHAIDCDKYDGWWKRLYAPQLPTNLV